MVNGKGLVRGYGVGNAAMAALRRRAGEPVRLGSDPAFGRLIMAGQGRRDAAALRGIRFAEVSVAAAPKLAAPETIDVPGLNIKVATSIVAGASKDDGDALAREINQQNPGRSFRLPTENELLTIFNKLNGQITGLDDYWIWTMDETSKDSGRFVLRILGNDDRDFSSPEYRYFRIAVLLVEY